MKKFLVRPVIALALMVGVALPVLAAYALAKRKPRKLKRLYDRRPDLMRQLTDAYLEAKADRDSRAEAATGGRRA